MVGIPICLWNREFSLGKKRTIHHSIMMHPEKLTRVYHVSTIATSTYQFINFSQYDPDLMHAVKSIKSVNISAIRWLYQLKQNPIIDRISHVTNLIPRDLKIVI
jgi:hypothetical protein